MLNPDADGFICLVTFSQELLNQLSSDATAPMWREDREIQNPYVLFRPVHIKPPNWLSLVQNYLIARIRKLPVIVGMLGVELHSQERFTLLLIPGNGREFLRARTGIDFAQE